MRNINLEPLLKRLETMSQQLSEFAAEDADKQALYEAKGSERSECYYRGRSEGYRLAKNMLQHVQSEADFLAASLRALATKNQVIEH